MTKAPALEFAFTLVVFGILAAAFAAASADTPAPTRIEARSEDLLAVGLVHADRMSIRLSRLNDNAPVRDAAVTVVLRGVAHPTIAEADGSYMLETKDLALPGAAAVQFEVAASSGESSQAASHETLRGTLQVSAGASQSQDKNSARQMWWWVLNFAVCFGFLWLYSRRRKATQE